MSDIFFPKFPICSNVFGHLGCNVRPDMELDDEMKLINMCLGISCIFLTRHHTQEIHITINKTELEA